ncbi:MAG TPA: hypothetical protein VFV50_04995, partial [Bdellovibrionales bacterium]|nr:hypothetical protein [Bdellovibrionales bacterium]
MRHLKRVAALLTAAIVAYYGIILFNARRTALERVARAQNVFVNPVGPGDLSEERIGWLLKVQD